MSKPFTFGVELEFNIDYISRPVGPPSESKVFVFQDLPSTMESYTKQKKIMAHIGQTIAAAGYRVDINKLRDGNIENWEVTIDVSIGSDYEWIYFGDTNSANLNKAAESEGGKPSLEYNQMGIEVVSPCLVFNEQSLREIEAVCALLTSTYRLSTNQTCGLHIHLGHHSYGFALEDLKKLMVFLYTFEPQISSLHPVHRYDHFYGNSMRHNNVFTTNFQAKYNCLPTATEFAGSTFAWKDRLEWFKLTRNSSSTKNGNYNIQGVAEEAPKDGILRYNSHNQTIEFRQHEGTLDGTRITQWVRTIVGMVTWVETCHPVNFLDFLTTMWVAETWEKMGDGEDARREAEMGPILAEYGYTIIDLLQHIGLEEQAEYYKDKCYRHVLTERPLYLGSDTRWEFERSGFDPESEEYKHYVSLKEEFTKLRLIRRAEDLAGLELTPLDHSKFPPHTKSSVWET